MTEVAAAIIEIDRAKPCPQKLRMFRVLGRFLRARLPGFATITVRDMRSVAAFPTSIAICQIPIFPATAAPCFPPHYTYGTPETPNLHLQGILCLRGCDSVSDIGGPSRFAISADAGWQAPLVVMVMVMVMRLSPLVTKFCALQQDALLSMSAFTCQSL